MEPCAEIRPVPRRHRGCQNLTRSVIAAAVVAMAIAGCSQNTPETTAAAPNPNPLVAASANGPVTLRYEVLDEIPRDTGSFTQGLTFTADGRLFESSGGYGDSSVQELDPATGAIIATTPLDPTWFAEGLATVNSGDGEELHLITWREETVAVLNPSDLTERRRMTYSGEGWGLCQLNATTLAMSDGTATIALRDAKTFDPVRTVEVTLAGQPVPRLNELECVDGLVWANVWQTREIIVIDPGDGRVVATLDASRLVDTLRVPPTGVLNGIARIPGTTDEFLITGKLWPVTYRVRVTPT